MQTHRKEYENMSADDKEAMLTTWSEGRASKTKSYMATTVTRPGLTKAVASRARVAKAVVRSFAIYICPDLMFA